MAPAPVQVQVKPGDPSYLTHLVVLTALSTGLTGIVLSGSVGSTAVVLRIALMLIPTIVTFGLLNKRNITLQRACALRLAHAEPQYDELMKHKIVLTAKGMSTIFQLLVTTSILANLPLLYIRLLGGNVMPWVYKADDIMAWWFAAINVTICVACSIMMLIQAELRFDFQHPINSSEAPLNKLDLSSNKVDQDASDWYKVATTSRRHEIWIKPVTASSKPKGVTRFDMTTRLASDHPLYNQDKHAEPAGPILHITLS